MASIAADEGTAPSSGSLRVAMEKVEELTNETVLLRRTNAALEQAAIGEVDSHITQFTRLCDHNRMLLLIIRTHDPNFTLDPESKVDLPAESQWLAGARERVKAAATEALGGMRLGYE
jgi:hypothetical protein